MTDSNPMLDSMCDALLMVYGLDSSVSSVMSLEDARDRVRAKARAIIERLLEDHFDIVDLTYNYEQGLREDNIDLIDTEHHEERPEPRWW